MLNGAAPETSKLKSPIQFGPAYHNPEGALNPRCVPALARCSPRPGTEKADSWTEDGPIRSPFPSAERRRCRQRRSRGTPWAKPPEPDRRPRCDSHDRTSSCVCSVRSQPRCAAVLGDPAQGRILRVQLSRILRRADELDQRHAGPITRSRLAGEPRIGASLGRRAVKAPVLSMGCGSRYWTALRQPRPGDQQAG